MKTDDAYVQQIQKMATNVNAWRAANLGRSAVVQFNIPPKVLFIGTLSEAVEKHFVYCDAAGRELLEAMGDWGTTNEPTVLMARIALEAADRQKGIANEQRGND